MTRNKRIKFSRNIHVRLSDFRSADPHPFGVLPGGNRFFGEASAEQQRRPREQDILGDNVWQQILGFCDGPSLGCMVQVTRYFYVAGHQPELWRDLVLRKCYADKKSISNVGKSWKDTYVLLFHHHHDDNQFVELRPIPVNGVYSDSIYQSHLCRSFDIPEPWLVRLDETNDREVLNIPVDKMNAGTFFADFEERNVPLVVRGAANGKAVDNWSNWDYLHRDNPQSKTFRTTSGAAPLPGNFSLRAYQEYTKFAYLEESPLYLFDRNAFASNKTWEDDFFPRFYDLCPYWDPSSSHGHDLLQHLGDRERPDHTWMIVGPKRSGSVFHIDPNCTHAWNACIQGRKRWIFYPPGEPPPGVLPSPDGDEVALPLSVGEWILQYWTEHMEQYHKRPVGLRPVECTTFPGDVIFVPHGWWHSVINLDDLNIAITHNYLSPSNLGNALKFFVEKQDHISGCRDRQESIKPERIYDVLVEKLKEKEPKHLHKALTQKGWTCRAWTNNSGKDGRRRNRGVVSEEEDLRDGPMSKTNRDCKSIMEKTGRVESFSFSFL